MHGELFDELLEKAFRVLPALSRSRTGQLR